MYQSPPPVDNPKPSRVLSILAWAVVLLAAGILFYQYFGG